jgi:hypothetical protein
MSKTTLHDVGGELYAITDGPGGQVVKIDPALAADVRSLVEARQKAGKELSKKLKDAGLGTAKDDEETVVV